MTALQNYTQVEKEYRKKQRDRVERQFKIGQSSPRTEVGRNITKSFPAVKPDATPEEIASVVDNTDGTGDQIFSQAVRSMILLNWVKLTNHPPRKLATSTRYGQSRTAYREVQDRHQDIKKIERTLEELAQLLSDVGFLSLLPKVPL